ncbi:MAG TPA: ATP-dependent sacrificial sulfur transferase LarE [Candidatus Acidoferrales bacterium]|jgi:pyridinium-3,5-biscarboxylic acid mononucleotide sulfurtransferase
MNIESTPAPSAAALIPEPDLAATRKEEQLFGSLRTLDSLLIAFSGGADSAYLAWAAHSAIGDRALSVTALSASFSRHDREQAEKFVRETGIRHEFIETHEFENARYVANNADRCYHCKDELFDRMESLASARKFNAIAYGINADDTHDFRPGHRAAHEHRVLTPLLDAALAKSEIRMLSQRAGLATWDRPASACLSSRVPYGTAVTPDLMEKIDRAESILRDLGFRQFRVRAHGELARIELASEEMSRGLEPAMTRQIVAGVKQAGFPIVTIDLEGYRQGSLNSLLKIK